MRRMAARIRALEVELGIAEPTISELFDVRAQVQDVIFDMIRTAARRTPSRNELREAWRLNQHTIGARPHRDVFIPADPHEPAVVLDHKAADCPKRVEVTRLADPGPRYVHGACDGIRLTARNSE